MALATTQGKQHALKELKKRRKVNMGKKKVNNLQLHAGSPMYYYCKSCDESMILPEDHTCPVPVLCDECRALKQLGWLE